MNGLGPTAEAGRPPAAGLLLVVALTLFWGLNWPAMKLVLSEMPVWPFRALCCGIAGVGMLLVAVAGRQRLRVTKGELAPLVFCAACNVTGWHLFTAYGLLEIGAGRASIVAFTMPIWAGLLSAIFLGERLTVNKLAALALGVAGLGVLVWQDMAKLGAAPHGVALVLCAALGWACGTIVLKRTKWTVPTVTLTAWQLLIGGAPIIVGTLVFHPPFDVTTLSPGPFWAGVYTLAIPMLICQWVWFKIVELFPASIAGISTLAIPAVGVISSALILGEPLGIAEVAALLLVLPALALVLLVPDRA